MSNCPLCGSDVLPETIKVDAVSGWVLAKDKKTRLHPREAELLTVLAESFPKPVARSTMVKRLWGTSEPKTADQVISVYVCRIRKSIRALGFTVQSVYDHGYVLVASAG